MKAFDDLKDGIVSSLVLSVQSDFWQEFRAIAKNTYSDVYKGVEADPNIVAQQKLTKLYQDRHFRMEHALQTLAEKYEIACSATLLPSNGYNYIYAFSGNVGFTQTYVKKMGSMPKPARYWQSLAEMAKIPRLDLGDEPAGALAVKDVYGLLAHNPIGSQFSEEQQRLGMIQFCVPSMDGTTWAVELTIEEILLAYPVEKSASRDPAFKQEVQTENADQEKRKIE